MIPALAVPAITRFLPYLVVCAALGGAYWLGGSHTAARCETERLALAGEAQTATISMAGIADAAAAQREQAKIIQQAALAGARKAIAEAPSDACIDAALPAGVLDALRLQVSPASP